MRRVHRYFSASSNRFKIKAAVARSAKEPFAVEDVWLARPGPKEVLVRVVATGLCHTDIVVKERGYGPFPIVLGHEGSGIVEEVGSAVPDLKVGDHVVMSYASCGLCPHCLAGKPPYCHSHGVLNFSGARPDGSVNLFNTADGALESAKIFGTFQQSSFATHSVVDHRNVTQVDRSWSLEKMAPLGCGIQTGAGAILNSFGDVSPGSSVAVFGCGAVGLSAIMAAAFLRGCTKVIAVDVNESRLKLAKTLGAEHTITVLPNTKQNVVEEIKQLTDGKGVNFALETSGKPTTLRQAVEALDSRGICGMVAPGGEVTMDMMSLLSGKSVRGIIQGDSIPRVMIPMLGRHYAAGRFPFDKLITNYKGLDSLNEAVKDCHKGATIKPVITI